MAGTRRRTLAVLGATVLTLAAMSTVMHGRPASATFPGTNGRIAFVRCDPNQCDIWLMNPDGSAQVDLTNTPAPLDEFDAEEALRIGFVQEVHPYGKHRERAMEIARAICKCAPLGLRATKAAALAYLAEAERAAVEAIPSIEKAVFATEDFKEGLQSFVERREARFQGR